MTDRTQKRSLPLLLSAALAGATVLFASMVTSGWSASVSGGTPSVNHPAITEAGRARQVAQFAVNWQADLDPIVTLPDGRQAKSSSANGVLVDGVRYYYNLAPHISLDPLGRGEVTMDRVVVKERIMVGDDYSLLVYTIPS